MRPPLSRLHEVIETGQQQYIGFRSQTPQQVGVRDRVDNEGLSGDDRRADPVRSRTRVHPDPAVAHHSAHSALRSPRVAVRSPASLTVSGRDRPSQWHNQPTITG